MTAKQSSLETYFKEASAWDRDRIAVCVASARRAWRVAAAAWICVLCTSAALLCLTPLKRVEPFLIRVDNSTGVVDVVPTYVGGVPLEQAVTRYFLGHYVSICQRFNYATAESDYEECGAFHTAQRNQAWYALWNPSNPQSPLNVHKDGSVVSVQIESISFFHRANGVTDLAQVRYLKAERPGAGAQERQTHCIATIEYAYGKPSEDLRMRRWNPLGFKIIDFVSETEVLRESASSPSLRSPS